MNVSARKIIYQQQIRTGSRFRETFNFLLTL